MELGRLGVWTWLDAYSHERAADLCRRIEELGYSALWIPEALGRDPFSFIGYLAARTSRLVFATGIANIYARDAVTMRAIRETLSEMLPDRFVMGLGVSHGHLVQNIRKHEYGKPVSTMRAYLESMEGALYQGPRSESPAPIVLAALRPKMLGLAKERARGAHPYFVTPEHTAKARGILGPDAWLAPEQKVLRETDPQKARTAARAAMKIYLGLPNYQNSLRWQGFEDADFADGGSDRLVDAIVAWGDEESIRERIRAHYEAGADHVCIQPLRADGVPGPDEALLEALAPSRAAGGR